MLELQALFEHPVMNKNNQQHSSGSIIAAARKSIVLKKHLYNKLKGVMRPKENREIVQREITFKNTE